MVRSAALLGAAAAILVPAAAAAQETSAIARPEPEIPILYLAPPPEGAELAPEERRLAIATLILPPPPNPNAVALPPAARALLEQAMDQGSPESFSAIAALARERYPTGVAQIDALSAENDAKLAERKAAEAREKADRLAQASFLSLWKGEAEIGGSLATGNTHTVALYGSLNLTREGLRWRHALSARGDFAKSDGDTTVDRDVGSYQPQYKLDDRLYVFGLAQFEHDRFLGYDQRYTGGTGLGYSLATGPRLKIDVEGGPAIRRTVYLDSDPRTAAAARGSINIVWKPTPVITLSSNTAAFIETSNSNIVSTTSLDTKLIGPLKARLSYNITYEQDTPDVTRNLNTLSRASLVYDF